MPEIALGDIVGDNITDAEYYVHDFIPLPAGMFMVWLSDDPHDYEIMSFPTIDTQP